MHSPHLDDERLGRRDAASSARRNGTQNALPRGAKARGTTQKALDLNLDGAKYGTLAEIGAGQEVARWFFRVGGAAGTVAKTMSAYDKVVSDTIYGTASRYVSGERLAAMLEREYELLVQRLGEERGAETTFFAFANTVAATAHCGPDEGHGWMGIRFQTEPRAAPSEIALHVRLLDDDNAAQQDALGIVGVNLIHGAFFLPGDPGPLLHALVDEVAPGRVEIDMVRFTGPAFAGVDHRLVSLQLVKLGLSRLAMFAPDGEILQPAEALYKRPVLVERGTFAAVTHVHLDMLEQAREAFVARPQVEAARTEVLMEMTMQELEENGEVSYDDFLLRADMLAITGRAALVSNYLEHYRLSERLTHLTDEPVGLVTGLATLRALYDRNFYESLPGGVLEAFGRLLSRRVRMYVYPQLDPESGDLLTASDLTLDGPLARLHQYLLEEGRLQSIECAAREHLRDYPEEVWSKRRAGDRSWKEMVPEAVARVLEASPHGSARSSA